jgi:hypothetical protein
MAMAGCSHDTFDPMQVAGLAPTGMRTYVNEESGTLPYQYPATVFNPTPFPTGPSAWPTVTDDDTSDPNDVGTDAPSAAHMMVSIRPQLYELTQGQLDGALHDFLSTAPAGHTSLLGLWHEASPNQSGVRGPNGIYEPYFSGLDTNFPRQGGAAGLLRTAQAYVRDFADTNNYNVEVGAIDVVGISTLNAGLYMAENLDFYACDIYDDSNCQAHPSDMLTAFKGTCAPLAKKVPLIIAVGETNSRCSQRRPWWFQTVWGWLQTNGPASSNSCSFLTFWGGSGGESGPWMSGDQATIAELNTIFQQSSP